jgi:hypothetical protein
MCVPIPNVVNDSVITDPDAIKIGFTGNLESSGGPGILRQRLYVGLETLLEEGTELSKLPFSER